jgi:hypothetical protein
MIDQHADLGAIIQDKILAGTLPKDAPVKFFTGYGTGKVCDACDLPTRKTDIEYEVEMEDGRTFVFHQPCLTSWHRERPSFLDCTS